MSYGGGIGNCDAHVPRDVPADFLLVPGLLPEWIDIREICKEVKRFVALHELSQFNAVAINDGRRVFTTDDRRGEFQRHFRRVLGDDNGGGGGRPISAADAAIVYDCQSQRQWLAPRPSAIQFLNGQV